MDYEDMDFNEVDDTSSVGEVWYRCWHIAGWGDNAPYIEAYPVVKRTFTGVRLLLNKRTGQTKFVLTRRRYDPNVGENGQNGLKHHMWARPTKELAVYDFLGRKEWKVKVLERELWQTRREIADAKSYFAGRLLLPTPAEVDATQYQQKVVAALREWIRSDQPKFHPVGTKKEFILW